LFISLFHCIIGISWVINLHTNLCGNWPFADKFGLIEIFHRYRSEIRGFCLRWVKFICENFIPVKLNKIKKIKKNAIYSLKFICLWIKKIWNSKTSTVHSYIYFMRKPLLWKITPIEKINLDHRKFAAVKISSKHTHPTFSNSISLCNSSFLPTNYQINH
jgi:hypothetical protein